MKRWKPIATAASLRPKPVRFQPLLILMAAVAAMLVAALDANAATNAEPAKKKGNECIFIRSVNQYQALDDDKIVIWAPGRRSAYLVELSMPLFGLEGAWKMAMIDHDRDGRLCGFSFDRIGVRDIGRPESASIKRMTLLDAEDLAALEEQYGVQLTRKKKDAEADAEAK